MKLRAAEGELRYSPRETLKMSCLDLLSWDRRGASLKIEVCFQSILILQLGLKNEWSLSLPKR